LAPSIAAMQTHCFWTRRKHILIVRSERSEALYLNYRISCFPIQPSIVFISASLSASPNRSIQPTLFKRCPPLYWQYITTVKIE
jgi:hypothetical protein